MVESGEVKLTLQGRMPGGEAQLELLLRALRGSVLREMKEATVQANRARMLRGSGKGGAVAGARKMIRRPKMIGRCSGLFLGIDHAREERQLDWSKKRVAAGRSLDRRRKTWRKHWKRSKRMKEHRSYVKEVKSKPAHHEKSRYNRGNSRHTTSDEE